MGSARHQKWVLRRTPQGDIRADDLELIEESIPVPRSGEFRVRSIYLSIDPGTRQWMKGIVESLGAPKDGDVIFGVSVGVVDESRHPDYKPGEFILGMYGWQNYVILTEGQKIKRGALPLTANISALGGTGATAYFGMELAQPTAGETVVVTGAAGATGSIAGQIGKVKGCRVVGIAGSDDKCRHVVERYGFDACINYKKENLAEALRRECPNRIDIGFENVGGEILEAIIGHLNLNARISLSGLISSYNAPARGPSPAVWNEILVRRTTIRGFSTIEFIHRYPAFEEEMTKWIEAGKVKYDVEILQGIDKAFDALQSVFAGRNVGKIVVQVAPEP